MCDCKSPRVKFTLSGRGLPCLRNKLYITPTVTMRAVLGHLYQIVPSSTSRVEVFVRDCQGRMLKRISDLDGNTRLATVSELKRNGAQITATVL